MATTHRQKREVRVSLGRDQDVALQASLHSQQDNAQRSQDDTTIRSGLSLPGVFQSIIGSTTKNCMETGRNTQRYRKVAYPLHGISDNRVL